MIEKLEAIRERFEQLKELMIQPEVIADIKEYSKLNKEYKDLDKVMIVYDAYLKLQTHLKEAKEVLDQEKDEAFRDMAKAEIDELEPQISEKEGELKQLLIPKDPNDSKDAILEIRAGAGGDEAAIFAGDLFRLYQRFAERQNWKLSIISLTEGSSGGYKEIIANISGQEVYGMLKFESGVHRVQRVPATETQGRVHTSAASVAVLPEMEEVEVELDMNEVRIDSFCSSGPGGQSVNTTYSAIRLTHEPTGIVVSCQDEKSKLKNLDKALKVLRSRLYDIELKKQQEEIGAQRKSMVGSGDRSDKIRTYNYPQGRVTDHRIGLTVYNLSAIMDGNIEEFVEKLRISENMNMMGEQE